MRPYLGEEEEKRRGGDGEEEKEELFYSLAWVDFREHASISNIAESPRR